MWTIKQPPKIIFGKNSVKEFSFPEKCLVVTSSGARKRGWLDHAQLQNHLVFESVESNPSIDTAEKIISHFKNFDFSHVVGIGGGSSMDVAKYCGFKMNKLTIMIPTTFGSGSEVTRISVLKVNGKKKSFHDDGLISDVALIDPYFIKNTNPQIFKNSVIDACAQCTEGYDSKIGNEYTKFLCMKAFELLEEGILKNKPEKIVLGSLFSGLGFGNCSTTLGHALSYVYSNEGISHGHALAFTTTIAHKFNNSIFYERFKNIVKELNFDEITLKQSFEDASELILTDRKHLDNNPKIITKENIIEFLKIIEKGKSIF